MNKPAPAALQELEKIVNINPDLGAAKMKIGTSTRKPVMELDDSFSNMDRVGYYGRKIKNKNKKPIGIRGSIGAFLEFYQDLPEDFIVHMELLSADANIITMQSPYMREVQLEASSGLESDTVEGIILDQEYSKGPVDIHFTSAYDKYLKRWVPVLISIIFGRSKKHYYSHWKSLFEVYKCDIFSYDDFIDTFPGVTMDWSDAEGLSFLDALVDFAHENGATNVDRKLVYAWVRKCSVHFKRSLKRVASNGGIVKRDDQEEFWDLIDKMTSLTTSFPQFRRLCTRLSKRFPKAIPWLSWHLHPDRASSFFPACQAFSDKERATWSKLPTDTNAQENVGKQFQELFSVPMSINESINNSWKFVNSRAIDRAAVLKGQSTNYSGFKKNLDKGAKKRKFKNPPSDHRALDTTEALLGRKGKKKKSDSDASGTIILYEGIKWNMLPWAYNTCPLDSFLDGIYLPFKLHLLVNPYPELLDSGSLLSRSFSMLNKNETTAARLLWITEFMGHVSPNGLDLWGFTDIFFSPRSRGRRMEDQSHPFFQSCEIIFKRTRHCIRQGGCESDLAILAAANDGSDDEIIIAEDGTLRQFRQRRIVCLVHGRTVLEHLKAVMDEKMERMCDRQLFDPSRGLAANNSSAKGMRYCKGPSILGEAEVVKWPHTMVFDMNGVSGRSNTLNDLPFSFVYKDKKLVLRTITLGSGNHFNCVVRCPDSWLQCDGMRQTPRRIKLYPLNQDNYEFMKGHSLNFVLYEVIDSTVEQDFGNSEFDFSTAICTDPNDNTTPELIAQGLSQTSKDAGALHKKYQAKEKTEEEKNKNKKEKTTQRATGRIPRGFSIRAQNQTRGTRPICKGCGKKIEYDDLCIRNSYMAKNHHQHMTIDQFHGQKDCLKKMAKKHLTAFKNKKWSHKGVSELMKQMEI